MNIILSEQLKMLRKEKGNTQEDLAVHLGITTQAVSKWEREEGFPDITLLPAIAAYYNVSVDDLLGVGEIRKAERLRKYRSKYSELFREGKSSERVLLMREAKREFPNELSVLHDLMYALQSEDRKGNADEIIEYGKRILNESTDNSLRAGAIQSLCFTYYYAKGDAEEAKKYAGMATNYYVTVNQMMPRFLDGEEAVEYCQSNIQSLVEMIGRNASLMIAKGDFTAEESIRACEFVIGCYDLLYSDGNCGFYHVRLSELYEEMAKSYIKLGNETRMLDCLEASAVHAVRFDTQKDGMYTAFMVNRIEMSSIDAVKDHTENRSGILLKALSKKRYAPWQDNERMKKLKESLESVAVTE